VVALLIRLAIFAALLACSACAGPGLLGARDVLRLDDGTVVTRTVGCGVFTNPHAAVLGCVSDVTVTVPPGACQVVLVTKPTFTAGEVLRQLDPLLPDEICPERIAPYD